MTRLALALLLATTTVTCSPCHTTPPARCAAMAAGRFRPAPDSAAVRDLEDALEAGEGEGLTGTFLRSHCRTKWQAVVESTHCSDAVGAYCTESCGTPSALASCQTGLAHEPAMDRCRAESLPVFVEVYTPCAGFHLCGNDLEASGPCP